MTKYKNSKEIVAAFINGAEEGFAGSSLVLSNIKIKGNQLFHFQTPIMERNEGKLIVNLTGYSPQTKKLQETIVVMMKGNNYLIARGVPLDYRGQLQDFIV